MRNLLVIFLAVASTGAVFLPKAEWSELETLVPATYFKIILNTEELYNDQTFYQRVYFLVLKNLKYFVQTLYARQNFLNQYVECSCPDGKFNPAILPQYWGQKFDFETPIEDVLKLHKEGYEYSRKMSEALKIVSNECPLSGECLNKFNNRFMDFLSGKEDTMINEFVFHQYLPYFFPKVFEPLYTADIFYPFQQAWGQFLSTFSAVPFTGFDFSSYPHYDHSFMSTPYFGKHYQYDFAHPSHFAHPMQYGMNFNTYPYSKYFDYPYSKFFGGFHDYHFDTKYPFYHNYDSKFGFNYPYYHNYDAKFGFNYPYYHNYDAKFGFSYPYYHNYDAKFGFNYPYYQNYDAKFGFNYPYTHNYDAKFGFNYPYHHNYDVKYPFYHNYDAKFGFNYPYYHNYDAKFGGFNYPYYHNYDAKFDVSHYPYYNHFDSKFTFPYSQSHFDYFPFGKNYYSGFTNDKFEPKYFENMEIKK